MNEEEKRKIIFDAVLELVKQNRSFSSLKVSDIAKQAGIAKGSIYMYFCSKERVLVEAIRYFSESGLKPFLDYNIDGEKNFETALKGFIEIQMDIVQNYAYLLNPNSNYDFLSMFNSNALPETIQIAQETRQKYLDVLEKVLMVGVNEKIINYVNIYSLNVAAQAISMTTRYHSLKDTPFVVLKENHSKEQLIQISYDMVVKVCK